MPIDNPLLAPSGQAAGLFPGRGRGTPADAPAGMAPAGGGMSPEQSLQELGGRAHISVPVLVSAALVGIILLHLGGFRFAFDVSVGR